MAQIDPPGTQGSPYGTPRAACLALEEVLRPGRNTAYPVEVYIPDLEERLRFRGIVLQTAPRDGGAFGDQESAAAKLGYEERMKRREEAAAVSEATGTTPNPLLDREDGWQGTEPAEGTRRHLIRHVLLFRPVRLSSGHGGMLLPASALELADEIESALLKSTIAAEDEPEERATFVAGTGVKTVSDELAEAMIAADRFREEREQAHANEDTFKAQRDASLNLLRWLIGDLLPSPASFPPGGPDPDRFLDEIGEIGETLTQINNKLDKA